MPLCSPWVDAADVALCSGAGLPEGTLDRAVQAASELLYAASGRQFSGLCEDVVRPCLCRCGTGPGCGCRGRSAVAMPRTPVVDVVEVLVDGEALTGGWGSIVDDRWLVRTPPGRWPAGQDVSRPSTEPGTWQVTYQYGTAVPAAGVIAAEVLACELVKGWAGADDCQLPRRVVSMTAEGTSVQFDQIDAQGFFAEGRLGLYEVDAFLATFNPHRLVRRARLISPRDARCAPRRVRVPTPGGGRHIYSGGTPSSTGTDIYSGGTPSDTGADVYSGGTP